ncbi:MAG: AraC family transcriptional regulator [Blautia sp.]|nr:AraC family transcriptional regulator [Lachnoclostridium sp.]MCM1212573.1 AraC family transcriptional regulator [Blautia sp.]
MHNDSAIDRIAENLAAVPDGQLWERLHPDMDGKTYREHSHEIACGKGKKTVWEALSGITLVFQEYLTPQVVCCHGVERNLLEINYCRGGRIGWNMQDGRSIYLGPGDFSLHTRKLCAGSVMTLPNGYYEGLAICIDLAQFDKALPELLAGTGITGRGLADKFCASHAPVGNLDEAKDSDGKDSEERVFGEELSAEGFSVFTGNEKTEALFSGFYDKSETLRKPYFVLKTLEMLLYLSEIKPPQDKKYEKYHSEQVETVREIHEYLLQHMEQRLTIDELSQKYLMNPTTLKAVFKTVYGESLASHMKEHRMEKAAALLRETPYSVSEIAKAVGYGSQSRFSSAFKEVYQMLPLEYRRLHGIFHPAHP